MLETRRVLKKAVNLGLPEGSILRRLCVSVMRGVCNSAYQWCRVGDSTYQWCGELAIPRITDTRSWRLPVSVIAGSRLRRWISPRIGSQNWNGLKGTVVQGTHDKPISAKTPRKSTSLPCLSNTEPPIWLLYIVQLKKAAQRHNHIAGNSRANCCPSSCWKYICIVSMH